MFSNVESCTAVWKKKSVIDITYRYVQKGQQHQKRVYFRDVFAFLTS